MANPHQQRIQMTLEAELPELRPRKPRNGATVVGKFLLSFTLLTLGSVLFYDYIAGPEPSKVGYIVTPAIILAVSFFIGYIGRESTATLGSNLVHSGVEDYREAWNDDNWGSSHQWQAENREELAINGIFFGIGIFVLEIMFSSLYNAVDYMMTSNKPQHYNKGEIASHWVNHLLGVGPSTQDTLFSRPQVKCYDIDELRSTLQTLVAGGFVQQTGDRFQVNPGKRHLFN